MQSTDVLPNKVDGDVGMTPLDLGEGERSDMTPDLYGITKHLPHFLQIHLPRSP